MARKKYPRVIRNDKTKPRRWEPGEDRFIRATFRNIPTEFLAGMLDRSYSSVSIRANAMGLKKSEAYLETAGRINKHGVTANGTRSEFSAGHVPHNKGKKWRDYMSKEGIRNSKKTQFKKGNLPPQTKATGDGTISIYKGHANRPIQYIRLKLGVWKALHYHNWEKLHGPVPKGMCLRFIDGDSLNPEPSNLKLITRRENRLLNHESITLPDKYVARMLVGASKKNRNPELVDTIVMERPDLIRIKRTQLLFNREIKKAKKNAAGKS